MMIFKGVEYCSTCKKKVVLLGDTRVHVETNGTLKLIEGHGETIGGGR